MMDSGTIAGSVKSTGALESALRTWTLLFAPVSTRSNAENNHQPHTSRNGLGRYFFF